MKILVIGDLHGRISQFIEGVKKFESEGYDKLIQIGDLADSYDRSNEDILACFKLSADIKESYGDRFIQLFGNHEWSYLFGRMMCSGYRPDLNATLNPWLNAAYKGWFQVAHQEGNTLFTHAGVQQKWFKKYEVLLMKHGFGDSDLATALNNMVDTGDGCEKLYEVGTKRGGWRGDYGGPMWADRVELESYGPIKGYKQIVGHTPCKFIERVDKFEGGKVYPNTSVTFTDCLGSVERFLDLEI